MGPKDLSSRRVQCMVHHKMKFERVMAHNAFWRHFGTATLPPVKVPGKTFWSRGQCSLAAGS